MPKKQFKLTVKTVSALARNKRLRYAGYNVSTTVKNGTTTSSSSTSGDLSNYVKFSDTATENKNGALSADDKAFIDALAEIFVVYDADEGTIEEGQMRIDYLSDFFKAFLFGDVAFTSNTDSLGKKVTDDEGNASYDNAEILHLWELEELSILFGGAKILMNYVTAQYGGLMLSVDKVYLDLLSKYIVETNPSKGYLIPLDLLSKFFGEFLNNNVAFTSDPSAVGERESTGDYENFQLWDFDGGMPLFDAVNIRMNYASDTHGGLMHPDDKVKLDALEPYSYIEKEEFYDRGNWATNNDAEGNLNTANYVNVDFRRDGTTPIFLFAIESATTAIAGVMSATDKTNLDNLYSAWQNSAGFLTSTEKSHYDSVYSAWQNSAGFLTTTEKSHYDSVYSAWQNSAGFLTTTEKANYDETYNKVSAGYIMSQEDKNHLDELYNAWKSGEL